MFAVIHFKSNKKTHVQQCAVVPASWLSSGSTFWPTKGDNVEVIELVKLGQEPNPKWPKFKVDVMHMAGTSYNYNHN